MIKDGSVTELVLKAEVLLMQMNLITKVIGNGGGECLKTNT
jgi:hypothetical protein